MLVCQDPTCKTKKNVQRKTNARCPNCKKKMTLFGRGKMQFIDVSVVILKHKNRWINDSKINPVVKYLKRNEKVYE